MDEQCAPYYRIPKHVRAHVPAGFQLGPNRLAYAVQPKARTIYFNVSRVSRVVIVRLLLFLLKHHSYQPLNPKVGRSALGF